MHDKRHVLVLLVVAAAACGPQPQTRRSHATNDNRATQPVATPVTTPAPPVAEPANPSLPEPARSLLRAHNDYRKTHCAPPLTWSEQVASVAAQWAAQLQRRGCSLVHSRNRYGENLAMHSGAPGDAIVKMWYDEVGQYDFARGGFSMTTGHFTQVVWKATRELGCAKASCGDREVWVCNYAPAGNVAGMYQDNISPSDCR